MLPLAYPPGIVRGPTDSMAPGRWYDGNLIRWRDGVLQPIGGWQRVTSSPMDSTARKMLAWVTGSNETHRIAVACDEHLYSVGPYDDDTYDTPRAVGSTNLSRPQSFSLAPWGDDLLACASWDGDLYRWETSSPAQAAIVATAPTSNTYVAVTKDRHVVLLGSGGNKRRVAWCSQEDVTDWDFADPANSAGYLDLDTASYPISAVQVREGLLIFTDADVWLLRYIGAPDIYALDPIAKDTTIMSPDAVAGFNGKAIWMGRECFYVYEGGHVQKLDCPLGDTIFDDIDPTYGLSRTHASHNGSFPEVWFFYPSRGSTEADKMVVWSTDNKWWGPVSELSRTAMIPAALRKTPFAAGTDDHIYMHETGWTDAGAPRYPDIYAEGGVFNLADGDREMTVTTGLADTAGVTVDHTFFVRTGQGATEYEKGPYQRKTGGGMDLRFTGRDVRMRVAPTADGDFSVGVTKLDPRPRGRRKA
jgi:hypothetical protein